MKQQTQTPVKRTVVRELKKLRTTAAKARSQPLLSLLPLLPLFLNGRPALNPSAAAAALPPSSFRIQQTSTEILTLGVILGASR